MFLLTADDAHLIADVEADVIVHVGILAFPYLFFDVIKLLSAILIDHSGCQHL
jgi:hypothetical protein